MTLDEAVRDVFEQHPDLADRAVVERFPARSLVGRVLAANEEVFAYQFMNTAGRNIATYIPSVAGVVGGGGLLYQPGTDGQGREYAEQLIRHTAYIGHLKK